LVLYEGDDDDGDDNDDDDDDRSYFLIRTIQCNTGIGSRVKQPVLSADRLEMVPPAYFALQSHDLSNDSHIVR